MSSADESQKPEVNGLLGDSAGPTFVTFIRLRDDRLATEVHQ